MTSDLELKRHLIHQHYRQDLWTRYDAMAASGGCSLPPDPLRCKFCHRKFEARNQMLFHLGIDHGLLKDCFQRMEENGSDNEAKEVVQVKADPDEIDEEMLDDPEPIGPQT